MANKPKVSSVTVKVPGVNPGPVSDPPKVLVNITLESGSLPEDVELVLYVQPPGNNPKPPLERYPPVGHRLINISSDKEQHENKPIRFRA